MSRVAVFGEMLVDRFDSGPVVGGAPFNVARHLAAFGEAPLMIGAVGDDADAARIGAEVERFRMRRDGIQVVPGRATGAVDVKTRPDGTHEFSIQRDCAWDLIAEQPAYVALQALASDGWLYGGTLALRSPASRTTGLALLDAHRGRKFLDLNWREGHVDVGTALEAVRRVDVLKVNDEELAMLCGWLGAERLRDDTAGQAAAVLTRLDLEMLLVTCGPAGALAFGRGGACIARARSDRPLRIVDTVGAGDGFAAVALTGLLRGWAPATMLARADEFAGHVCEIRGAVPADLSAYRAWSASW